MLHAGKWVECVDFGYHILASAHRTKFMSSTTTYTSSETEPLRAEVQRLAAKARSATRELEETRDALRVSQELVAALKASQGALQHRSSAPYCQSYWPPIFSGQDTGWRGPSKPPNLRSDHDRRRIQQRVLVMQWMRHTVATHSRRSVDAACSAFAPWTIFVIGLSFLNVRDSEWR